MTTLEQLTALLDAASPAIPYTRVYPIPGAGADTPEIEYAPEATQEQRDAGAHILAVTLPAAIAEQAAAVQAVAAAIALYRVNGCAVTIGERTITFAATVEDYDILMSELGRLVDLDLAGVPDAPEKLMNREKRMETLPDRATARAFLRQYGLTMKPVWAAAYPAA